MKERFFYAAPIFRTWSKLFVLTEDGKLYSEYLDHYSKRKIDKEVDFSTFKENEYSFGGYQTLKEISKEEIVSIRLKSQGNWVESYLSNLKKERPSSKDLKQIYLERIEQIKSLKLVIVGQDPYPQGANGIAFCKNTFEELQDEYCCGKEVLHSLGIDIDELKNEFSNPIEMFFDLLDKGIAFINVNHTLFSENTDVNKYKLYNNQFLNKTDKIVVLGLSTAKVAFQNTYPEYQNVNFLIHPSGKAKTNNLIQWVNIWAKTYLKDNFLTKSTIESI